MQQGEWIAAEVSIDIQGVPLRLKLNVPNFPVKPQAMLPLFQALSDKFSSIGVQVAERSGRTLSCKAGCSACCRQPIPLSEIEVYYIAQLVKAMPEPRRSEVKNRFQRIATSLHENGWYEKFELCENEQAFEALIFEYMSQVIPCPFLEADACSIYAQRPLICREYMVTSPAAFCSEPDREAIARIELPASATHGACRVGRSKNLWRKNFQIMSFALLWAGQYPEPFTEKTGEEWLREFFGAETAAQEQ